MSIRKTIIESKTGNEYSTLKKAIEIKFPGMYVERVWIDSETNEIIGSSPLYCYGSLVNSIKSADESISRRCEINRMIDETIVESSWDGM